MIDVDDPGHRLQVEQLLAAYGLDIDGLCRACLTGLPGIGGVGVTMMTPRTQQVRYASDAVSARVEQLQFLLGEGPCRDAYATAGPVLADDLRAPIWLERWPAFAPAAVMAGAQAVFALPLRVGTTGVGVLDLYRDSPGELAGRTLTDARVLAEAVVELILVETVAYEDGDNPAGAGDRLLQGAAVHQATGMISVQVGVPVEDALARLRAHAYATGRDLDEVAADVVARRLRFDNLTDDEDR
ncbi:GAF and ANTAR domain-containing protein [Actinoplanes oblitus]|uniref:GAF and ANTAR domain-containing protein n=1 Tax=Actinoplanes oblitus TaxID=3040509 RepID=A0ABY8W6A6_9ACTN|nr:GAF and ANTAR domain-containing protein [Actinoplanes oblitus]WIM92562.1 GAF and ANTAR domain-containing protein [Actinoplanes oblitus]